VSTIIIGVDGSERSADAVAFGTAVARAAGAGVVLVNGYMAQHGPYSGAHAYEDYLRDESERLLKDSATGIDTLAVETRAFPGSSPAEALHETAAAEGAGLIVVGSSHVGRAGRVLPGSTAERLLHGAPCAVAIVPHGYRGGKPGPIESIVCGWNAQPEAERALGVAEALALGFGATLRVVSADQAAVQTYPGGLGVDFATLASSRLEAAERKLAERVAQLPEALRATGELMEADAVSALGEASQDADLVVIGSRGYGPLKAVLLGGVSGKLIRVAHAPVIVVPRGATPNIGSLPTPSAVATPVG
jgi:nucleotide-binding universal stress UspA family protein